MKKTIFTIFSVAAMCSLVFLACKKEDDTGVYKTNYSTVSNSNGTGGNPNPNNNPSSTTGGVTTSTTGTTTTTTYGSINDGTSYTFTGSTSCSAALWTGTTSTSGATLMISFPSAPSAGAYTTVQTGATAGQCIVTWKGGNALNGGTVTVTTSGSKLVATLTFVMWGTSQLTGSLTCQ